MIFQLFFYFRLVICMNHFLYNIYKNAGTKNKELTRICTTNYVLSLVWVFKRVALSINPLV